MYEKCRDYFRNVTRFKFVFIAYGHGNMFGYHCKMPRHHMPSPIRSLAMTGLLGRLVGFVASAPMCSTNVTQHAIFKREQGLNVRFRRRDLRYDAKDK